MIILNAPYSVDVPLDAGETLTVEGRGGTVVSVVSGLGGSGTIGTVDGSQTFGAYGSDGVIRITAVDENCSYGVNAPQDVTAITDASGATVLSVGGNRISPSVISNTRPNFEVSGVTTETEAGRIYIPGGLMLENSALLITTLWRLDGADAKNLHMRAGNDATTTYATSTRIGSYSGLTTQDSIGFTTLVYNNNSVSSQLVLPVGASQPFGVASAAAMLTPTIDTALDWSIFLGAKCDALTDPLTKCVLLAVLVELK